jgi:hypothetical protein
MALHKQLGKDGSIRLVDRSFMNFNQHGDALQEKVGCNKARQDSTVMEHAKAGGYDARSVVPKPAAVS